jgi:hypothetical protein
MCEGYTELATLVAIFCSHMTVEKKSRRLNTSSCSRLAVIAVSFFDLIVLCRALNMSSRGCVNAPNCVYYICGEFMIKKHKRNIKGFIRKLYYAYFSVKLGDQDVMGSTHGMLCLCRGSEEVV